MRHFLGKKMILGLVLTFLFTGFFALPAWAQVGTPTLMEKPAAPPPEEKKEAPPTTCGPMISDTCVPIDTGKFAMQAWWALSLYPRHVLQ